MIRASVVIPTRNRDDELKVLLISVRAQTVPLEVLVMDDGASDETRYLIESEFPEVAYHRLGYSKGPAFQRNRGVELARSNIVFPFDDDTELPSPRTIEQTIAAFDDPRVGAVGMPYVNLRLDDIVRQRAPGQDGNYLIHAFVGAAHALRRDVFLSLGGYREHFFYMGEEGDFCVRLLQAGYITIAGRADIMHHYESPRRSLARADYYGRRNDILFVWHNAPLPAMAFHLPTTAINGIFFALTERRYRNMLRGAAAGWVNCATRFSDREPVDPDIYALYRLLKHRVFTPLDQVEISIFGIKRHIVHIKNQIYTST